MIPRLVDAGVKVRIATTVEPDRLDHDQHDRLCTLHRWWGIPGEDRVVRPVITRGRAIDEGLGQTPSYQQFPPELTISVDGAYWGAFGPSFQNGVGDTDFPLTRTIDPVAKPAEVLHGIASGRPEGAGAEMGNR